MTRGSLAQISAILFLFATASMAVATTQTSPPDDNTHEASMTHTDLGSCPISRPSDGAIGHL